MSIKRKIPFLLISLICVPLFILAGIIYYYSTNVLIQKSKDNIYQIAQIEGKAFQALLNERKYEIRLLARDNKIVRAVDLKTTLDNETFYNSQAYDEARDHLINEENLSGEGGICRTFIVDTEGNIIMSSDIKTLNYTIKEREYYKRALQGETVFSDVMTSKLDDTTVIAVATPIRNNSNRIVAVACKTIANKSFSDFISKIKLGETGYGYLVDKDGYLIAHPDQLKEGSLIENEKVRYIIESLKSKEVVEEGIDTYLYQGQKKYIGFHVIPDLNWILCVVQNVEEINRQAYMDFLMVISMSIFLMVMMSIASMRISKMVCEPIDELMKTMNNVAKGDLKSYCTYVAEDELGQLSKDYNSMIKTLAHSQDALKASEEKYRLTLEALEEVIWEYDLETKEFSASDKLKEVMGYSGKEIDITDFINKGIIRDYRTRFKETLRSCLMGKQEVFEEELLLHIPGQEEKKWILCRGTLIRKKNRPHKFLGVISDITLRKENEEKVRKLAYFDTLTGLLNKQTFTDILKEWIKPGIEASKAALFFIDLDQFKNLNDTLGHDVGDMLLNCVGQKLKYLIPSDTLICRFGGDEFVIFKNHFGEIEEIQELASNILDMFKENIVVNGKSIHTSCSIGIALCPLDGSSADILLKNADTAMYKAKTSGRNRYSFYDEKMSKTLGRKLLVERGLREALINQCFFVKYQPIIDLNTGEVVAAEALMRLESDEAGLISPAEFIPIAEETGLIIPMGEWVLETALRQLKRCRKIGCENLSMAINISSAQIKQEKFIDRLKMIIEKCEVPPQLIKLEITESMLIENLEKNIELFNDIKKLGIQMALDDFGTGYSSLNYLCNIPFDVLKIDKSFIDEIVQKHSLSDIVDSIINMAHSLGIKVIAEGIETEEQLEIMRQKKCDMVQGYVFSRPLLQEEFENLLKLNNRKAKDTSAS